MKKFLLVFAAMFAMAQMNADVGTETAAEAPVAATASAAYDGNDLAYHHPFRDDEENTKHWSFTTNGFYLGLGVDHNWDAINNSFEIGILNLAAIRYNSLHGQNISLGVGFHHRSYSMKRPIMLERGVGSQVVTVGTYPSENIDKIKDRSSNLNVWGLQFPLVFKQKIFKKLDLGVAGILNWNTYARVDNHYEMDKVEYDTKYKNLKQNKVNFDFMGTLLWDDFGVYCRYSPSKVFKEGYGPEIKETWTLGFLLAL